PLTWLGVVEPVLRRPPVASDVESFRVTALGRLVLTEGWELIIDGFGTSLSDGSARVTLQPNLEMLAPPDLDPAVYLNLARLGELEANPRFAPYIQRRIGDQLAFLTSNVDLGQLSKELRKAGYSVSAAGTDKVQVTAHGAQLTLTRPELEELYAAVRASTKLAHEVDPDFDLSALAALEETLALELTRREDAGAQERA